MTGKDALTALVEEGFFIRRDDGVCYAFRCPRGGRELDRFVDLVRTLGAYSVKLDDENIAPIGITRGGEPDSLMFKVQS